MWRRGLATPAMRKLALGGSAASGIATLVGREVGCEAFGESDKAASTDIHEISNWQDAHAWRDVAHLIEQKLEDKVIHPLRDTVMRYSGYSVYLAYTSDLGESFARILPAWAYYTTYGISAAYVIGDVAYNSYKQFIRTRDRNGIPDWAEVRMTCLHASVYQFIVSLAFPYFVIHNTVHFSEAHIFKSPRFAAKIPPAAIRWGPAAVAVSIIPFLPLVDPPVEWFLDWAFQHKLPHSLENAEIAMRNHDRIMHPKRGKGVVVAVDPHSAKPYKVQYDNGEIHHYSRDQAAAKMSIVSMERVTHPKHGKGVLREVVAHSSDGKLFVIQFENGEVHHYSKAQSDKKLAWSS